MSLESLPPEARDELAALAQQLAENPETRKEFLRMTKKVKPDLPIPELDIDGRLDRAREEMASEVEKLRQKLAEKEAKEELESRRRDLLKKGKVQSEEDIQAVEKIMLERGITNHETAAEYHEWMKQAAQPTPSGYNPSVMKKFDLGQYMKNPVNAAREEAMNALKELRAPKRPIGL